MCIDVIAFCILSNLYHQFWFKIWRRKKKYQRSAQTRECAKPKGSSGSFTDKPEEIKEIVDGVKG